MAVVGGDVAVVQIFTALGALHARNTHAALLACIFRHHSSPFVVGITGTTHRILIQQLPVSSTLLGVWLFVAQRDDRVESGGFKRWIVAKENADPGGKAR